MLVNKVISEEMLLDAGKDRTDEAEKYLKEERINIIKSDYKDPDNFSITSNVTGNKDEYQVNIEVKKAELNILSCECQDYLNHYSACKHIVATLLKFEQTKFWDKDYNDIQNELKAKRDNKFKYKNFNNLINSFYNSELEEIDDDNKLILPEKEKAKLDVKINYDKFQKRIKT